MGLLVPVYPFVTIILMLLSFVAIVDLILKVRYYSRIEKKLNKILESTSKTIK